MTEAELLCQKFGEEAKTLAQDANWMNGFRAGQESMEQLVDQLATVLDDMTKHAKQLNHDLAVLDGSIRLLCAQLRVMLFERGIDLDAMLLEIKQRNDNAIAQQRH